MSPMRFSDLNPEQVLDMTSLTVQEFRELVPPFEEAFEQHMAKWRTDCSSCSRT